MSAYKFTAMKNKSNKVKTKGGDGSVQPTLFQTWGTKRNVPTSNFNNGVTTFDDDIAIVSDDEDDILVQALESSQGKATSSPENTRQSAAGAPDNDGEIDLESIPDLPGFNKFAGSVWIYPTNYPVRQYQFDISKEALFKNTLVVLPTGLGKTFIAAVVMFNFYRWYSSAKVVFMAPTKPLVAQQIEACYNIMGIPQEDMSEMTGKMLPTIRKRIWKEKRVIFLTPQVLVNDLTRGTCDPESIKCVVVDEAHKSLGNHAYCQVIREIVKKTRDFRVLALSATPGNNLKMVQEVLTNLLISHVAIRTEESPDVKIYSNERKVEKIVVPLGSEIDAIQKKYVEVLESVMHRLTCRKLLYSVTATTVSKFTVLKARDTFRQKPPQNLSPSVMGSIEGDFGLLISLCHGHELLQLHGLRSFYQYITNMMDNSNGRSRQELFKNPAFIEIYEKLQKEYGGQNISFTQMSTQEKTVPYVLGHPKLEKLLEIVVSHFKNFQKENGNLDTRVMIFSQYRNSVTDIAEMLKRERPLIKAMSFIGQSVGKNTKGFTQKEQIKVMKEFREGGYNTLIATCVGEEGLDIGDVDLIICFDACKSPVRFVQRMGRTGRKRAGKIIMLITKGKEEQTYNQARYQWNSLNKSLSNKCGQLVFYNYQPTIFPEGLVPLCHKTNIVVKESFQSIHSPKQKKPKKPLKKQKTSSKKDNQDISLFTSPVAPTVDTYLQPTTSGASRVHLVNEPGRDRMYTLLSSSSDDDDGGVGGGGGGGGDCKLPDLNATNSKRKEKLFGKKTSKTLEKETKTLGKTKKKSEKIVGKSKNQIGKKMAIGAMAESKKKKTEKNKESFSGGEILNDEAFSSSPRFGSNYLLNKKNLENCSESVSDLLLSKEANSEISKEALGDPNHSLPDVPLSPVISSNVRGSSLQMSKGEKSLHGSMVPAAPDFETIPKLIDDFGNVQSSQSSDLDLGYLTKKWDNEFGELLQGGMIVNSLKASETVVETPFKGPLAISKNVSCKRKLESDDDVDEDVMMESEKIGNISGFAPNISEEMAEKTVKSDKLRISEENTPKSTAKCQLGISNLSDKDLFWDSSFFIDDDFEDSDVVVRLISPQLTNATNTKVRTNNSISTSRLSNTTSNRTNRVDTNGPSSVISKTSPNNTTTSSTRSSTTSPVDTSNVSITTVTTRPLDASITTSPSNTNSLSNTTTPSNTNITTRPSDKNITNNTSNTTMFSDTSNTTVSTSICNTSVKPNWVFKHQKPINEQINADNKVPANDKKLNLDTSLSVSKPPTNSKSSLELCDDNGGELVDDGISFDLSADMFSDFDDDAGDDLGKGKNDSNSKPRTSSSFLNDDQNKCLKEAPYFGKETGPSERVSGDGGMNSTLGCKLSSLINSHTTVKDSLTDSKISEESLNFDLEFDSEDDNLFKSLDNAGQQSNLVLEDNDVPEFSLEFDFDDASPLMVNESCFPQGNQSETIFGVNINTANSIKSQSEEKSQSSNSNKTVPFQKYSTNSAQIVETMVSEEKKGQTSGHLKLPSLTVAESPFQCATSKINLSHGLSGNVTPQPCGKVTPGPSEKVNRESSRKVTPGPSRKVTPKSLQQPNSYSNSLHGSVKSCSNTTTTTTVAGNDDDDVIVLDDDDDDDDDEVIIKPKRRAVIFSPSSDGSTPTSEVKGRRGTSPSASVLLSSDLDSPVTIPKAGNKRFTGKKCRLIEDESNESDFENDFEARLTKPGLNNKRSTPKPVVVSQSKRRKIHRRNVNSGRQFLDEEAAVSGSDSEFSNDDEIANELDNYEESFVDDNYTLGRSQVDMRTVYLKSVKSPLRKGNAYKLQYKYHAMDVFSQVSETEADCYEEDSFLDDSSEISTYNDTTENATQEIVLMAKSKSKNSKKKRIIHHLPSTSEEEEEEKEENRFALSLDLQEKCPKATTVPSKPQTCKPRAFQNREPVTKKLALFADSRQISGAQEILSNLRSQFNMDVVVTKLNGSDFLVSLRTGVERIYMSEFSNFSNNHKITERLQQLIDLHDRPCLIVEKNPVKRGLASTKTPFYQTKYLEKFLSRISLSPIKLLFSDNKDETCSLLAKLCSQEEKRGFAIACPNLTLTEEQRVKFLLSLPQLNYALALNLCKNYTSMKQLLTSSAEEIAEKGKTSAALANKIHHYIHQQTTSKDL